MKKMSLEQLTRAILKVTDLRYLFSFGFFFGLPAHVYKVNMITTIRQIEYNAMNGHTPKTCISPIGIFSVRFFSRSSSVSLLTATVLYELSSFELVFGS